MNKTVSINLGGYFFHIDEDAYQKLNRYFDAIKRSLSPDGKDEIMNDIESRIAELLSEKLKNDKQVVSVREVEEIISVMGQPEDYRIDEETTGQSKSSTYYPPLYNPIRSRKFYRDGDRALISGVCAGIAHYFRIDPLWIRILFIISPFMTFGTSILVYLLLWILIPKAITTTEKLEMTGEPINISNIEKKVREEILGISERLQNVDYDKLGANARTGAEKIGNTIGDMFSNLFKAFVKVLGALITIFSALALGGLIIAFITLLFTSSLSDTPWYHYANMANYTDVPLWLLGVLGLLSIGIPLLFLFLLGLKILVNNMRPVGSAVKYTLLALWIIAVSFSIYLGVRQASEISFEGKTVQKEQLALSANDTLYVKFRYNDYYAKSLGYNTDFRITQDSTDNDILYSNNVELFFMRTDAATPYMQVERTAEGNSMSDARKTSEKIKYNFEIQGNKLILDNYLVTDVHNKFRNQRVKIFIYLPEGIMLHADKSIGNYHYQGYDGLYVPDTDEDHLYRLINEEMKCLDCPEEENNEDDNNDEGNNFTSADGNIHITDDEVNVNVSIKNDSLKIRTTSKTN